MKVEKSRELIEFEKIQITILFWLISIIIVVLVVVNIGRVDIYKGILYSIVIGISFFAFLFLCGSIILSTTFVNNKVMYLNYKQIKSLNRVKYHIMIGLADIFKLDKKYIRRFFIKVNDIAVMENVASVQAKDVLILAPHCLQDSKCEIKITEEIGLCKRCGKCNIKDLTDIKESYGVKVAIANGGTSARKKIMDSKPKFVLAVACERDLIEGIIDTGRLQVYGILNETPNGPCINTKVDIEEVKRILHKVISNIK